jgi:hypothetical protein
MEAQKWKRKMDHLLLLESRTTTSPRVEACFPRDLAQKNGITCISNVCESWGQQEGIWKVLGAQEWTNANQVQNGFLLFLESHVFGVSHDHISQS